MFIDTSTSIIHIKLGKACVPGMVSSGYAFIILSIFPILTLEVSGFIVSAVLILFGSFLAFTTCGVDLDIENKRLNYYRKYFFFIKRHQLIDITRFEYITVLMFNMEYIMHSKSNRSTSLRGKKYDIYLLNETKLDRQLVASFNHAKPATDFAKTIAGKLNILYIASHSDKSWE